MGAKTDVKNEKGLTPYDLAVRSDYNSILALFNEPKEPVKTKARPRSAIKKKKGKIRHSSSEDSDSEDSDTF